MQGQKEVVIEKPLESNEFVVELNLKVSMNSYKLRLSTKKKWVVAAAFMVIKIVIWQIRDG